MKPLTQGIVRWVAILAAAIHPLGSQGESIAGRASLKQGESPNATSDPIEDLARLLEARDAATPTYQVKHEVRSLRADELDAGRLDAAPSRAGEMRLRLLWQVRGDRYAVKALQDETDPEHRTFHAVWDGATFRKLLRGAPRSGGAIGSPGGAPPGEVLSITGEENDFLHSMHPERFGRQSALEPWPVHLRRCRSLRILGRERAAGRDCLRIAYENGPPPSPGEPYRAPVVVWFDDRETLLAVKQVQFGRRRDGSADRRASAALAMDLNGQRYEPLSVKETIDVHGRPPALHLPHHVVRIEFDWETGSLGNAELHTFEPSSLRVADEIDTSLFTIPVADGTRVADGRTHSLSISRGGSLVPALDDGFRSVAEAVAREDGVSLAAWPDAGASPETNGCGALALALAATLLGKPTLPDFVTALLPKEERESHRATVASLASVARTLGLHAVALEAKPGFLDRLPRNFLTLVETPALDGTRHGPLHWVVAAPVDYAKIRIVCPPEPPVTVPRDRFERLWTGACVVLTMDAPFPLANDPAWRRAAPVVGAALVLLGMALLTVRRARDTGAHDGSPQR